MLSHRKTLLRRTEYLVAIYVPIAVFIAFEVDRGRISPTQVESRLWLVIVVLIYMAAIWLALMQEFVAHRHGASSERVSDTRLPLADVIFMQQWCPGWLKASYAIATVLFVYVFAYLGHVRWSSSAPFTRSDAMGFLLLSSTFALLALPTIASASRMPGTYAELRR